MAQEPQIEVETPFSRGNAQVHRLPFVSPLFIFLSALALAWDASFGMVPFFSSILTFFFTFTVGIQLTFAGYSAGVMRFFFAQGVVFLLELFLFPLPSALMYMVVHNIFNFMHHQLEKRRVAEEGEEDDALDIILEP